MSIRAALLTQLLTVWAVVGIAATPPQKSGSARVVRVYGAGGSSELLDLSGDGSLLLAQQEQTNRCSNGNLPCRVAKLDVYDTNTGQRIGELVTQAEGWNYFSAARFASGRTVLAIQNGPGPDRTKIEWNPFTGEKRTSLLVTNKTDSAICLMDDGSVLQLSSEKGRPQLNLLADESGRATISQPDVLLQTDMNFDCRGWRSERNFLLEGAESDNKVRLYWISASANVPYRACWTQSDEQLYGHAVSPDGSLVIAITGTGNVDGGVIGAKDHLFLNVIRAGTGETLRKLELQFPNKPEMRAPLLAPKNKYLANALLASVFAKRVAASPDNTKVAIAYGIRTGDIYSNAVGYFDLFTPGRTATGNIEGGRFPQWHLAVPALRRHGSDQVGAGPRRVLQPGLPKHLRWF